MDIFQKAIAIESSISHLAKTLGLPINRVCNWQNPERGVPDGWLAVMQDRYGTDSTPWLQRERNLPGKTVVSGSESGM